MRNRYRVVKAPPGWPDTLPFRVSPVGDSSDYGIGDEFDHEFATADEEREQLQLGLVELLPNEYKVVGDSNVHETAPGETFSAAIPWGNEEQLVAGGHIERVGGPEPEPEATATPTKPRKPRTKKED